MRQPRPCPADAVVVPAFRYTLFDRHAMATIETAPATPAATPGTAEPAPAEAHHGAHHGAH